MPEPAAADDALPPSQEAAGDIEPLDVVVPVFDEESTAPELLRRLRALPFAVRPIFVDNGSTDGTLPFLRSQPDIVLIEHGRNLGYGASLKDGIAAARGTFVVIIDADLEFPPEEIPRVRAALETSDAVYASRFLEPGAERVMPRFRIIGNRVVSGVFNLLYRQSVTDLYTGFKGLRRSRLEGLRLDRDGFEHVLELSARLARRDVRITEIPIQYQLRRTGRSKMKHVSETIKLMLLIVLYRFQRPLRRV